MRSFCVECGTEGRVYEGLCQECLPEKRSFVTLPDVLEVPQCGHCGAFDLPGGWQRLPWEAAVETAVRDAASAPRAVRSYSLVVEPEAQDPQAVRARWRARVELEGMDVVEEGEVPVRLPRGTCPECAKQRGEYFEAILQLRARDRPVTEEEQAVVRRAVAERVRSTEGLFLTREEAVHGGLDFYLSRSGAARALARDLGARLGALVSSSPRLHTRKAGKDLYRVTYLVRLPPYRQGDVLRVNGRPHRVLRLGKPVVAADLTSGRVYELDPRTLADREPVDARVVEPVIVYREGDEMEVLDPETQEVLRVKVPPALDPEAGVVLVRAGERAYLAPAEAAAVK